MRRLEWSRCPSWWIQDVDLFRSFCATGGERAANTVALMCMTVIVHAYDVDTGIARVTFDDFARATDRSRTLIAAGLRILKNRNLIDTVEQSHYELTEATATRGWAKFPYKSMYQNPDAVAIGFFHDCTIRKRAELDALKLLFLFCAFRSESDNRATISYDKIIERTGISRANIKSALALLAAHSLVYTEHKFSAISDIGIANCYRVRGVESNVHRGTRGRTNDSDVAPSETVGSDYLRT